MSLHYLGKYFKVPLFSINRENVKVSVWHIFRSSRNFNIKIKSFWTREMSQQLTTLVTLLKDPILILEPKW